MRDNSIKPLALALFTSILLPVLAFPLVPTFLGRIAVVVMVAAGMVAALAKRGWEMGEVLDEREWGAWTAGYGVVMCVLAGVVG